MVRIIGRKYKDISGQKFGRLTALYRLNNYHDNKCTWWLCICECGNLTEVRYGNLKRGGTVSCGCYANEKLKKSHTKHGGYGSRIYATWQNMKSRCYYTLDKRYKDYGWRGITVCKEWKDDFQAFYDWAMNNGYDDSLTIDRIDVNGNYSPDNCRWTTRKQQVRNRRNNRYFTINGETNCLSEWCEIYNVNYWKTHERLKRGWDIEKALTT